eukprot:2759530-Ditylum_brightwellii.AAC.1
MEVLPQHPCDAKKNLNKDLEDDICQEENLCSPRVCKHLHRPFKATSHHQACCIQYATVLSSQIETLEKRIEFDTDGMLAE